MAKFKNAPCNQELIRRNLDLWNDRKHGFSYLQLSDKYCISRERCRQIYLRMERVRINHMYGLTAKLPIYKKYFDVDMKEADND